MAFIGRMRDTTRDGLIDVDDAGAIFIASPAGGEPVSLTEPGMDVMSLAWSPAGDDRLALHAHYTDTNDDRTVNRDDNASIFVLSLNCGDAVPETCVAECSQLTDASANDHFPTWSPALPGEGADSAQLAFASNAGPRAAIEVIDADCAAQEAGCMASRRALVEGEGLYLDPAWSPDGRYVAFLALRDTRPDGVLNRLEDYAALYLVEVATGNLTELAPADSPKGAPAWSPDGHYLAYYAFIDTDGDGFIDSLYDRAGIFVVDVRVPPAPYRITGEAEHATDPAWSPIALLLTEGRLAIAYSALTDTNGDGWLEGRADSPSVFVVEFAGATWGPPRALTSPATLDYAPTWSPDGNYIAYVGIPAVAGGGAGADINRRGSVLVVEAGCTSDCTARRISPEDMDAFAPVWAP